ncbi:MAG TPA: tetratricopeptide repeat protein, partial [Chloroflexota bacterium]
AEEGLRLAYFAGMLWLGQRRLTEARTALDALLALDAASRPNLARAYALDVAYVTACKQGDTAAAKALAVEQLAIASRIGSRPAIASALQWLAMALRELGDLDGALAASTESLTLWHDLGNRELAAAALIRHGEIYQARGELERARAAYEQSATEFAALGTTVKRLHHHRGSVCLEQGDLAAARVSFERYIKDLADLPPVWVLSALADFAELAVAERRPELALRLASTLEAFGSASGTTLQATERRPLDRWLTIARQALTPEEIATAWQEGQNLTPEQSGVGRAYGSGFAAIVRN